MELYLGSVIEPIQKSIRNTLYFNSKHAPKTLGEAMQKAQDLHIKHLYAIDEDQQDSTVSDPDVSPEIIINEMKIRDNRGWYQNRHEDSEHLQNSCETPRQMNDYKKKVKFDRPYGTGPTANSEFSESSSDSRVTSEVIQEADRDKSSQQPSIIH